MESQIKNILNDKRKDILLDCVLKTIKTNFVYTPTIITNPNILDNNTNKDEFDEKFTTELIRQNIPRIVSQEQDTKSIYMQGGYILMIKYIHDCESLASSQIDVNKEHIKYLIIVFNYSREKCEDILLSVGPNMSMNDVTYILKKINQEIDIVTFVPQINASTCSLERNLQLTTLSNCSNESFNAFPNKNPHDYMQCTFKIGMASMFPFAQIPNKHLLKNYDHLHEDDIEGSDLEIIRIMAQYFNFTADFYYVFKYPENPFINMEFLPLVLNQSLDICAGGMYRMYGDLVDYSGVYNRQAAIWLYPVKRDERSWQKFVGKVNGLYIFIIFYFIHSCIWKLFCIFDEQAVPIARMLLHNWGALIGTSSLEHAISLKQKILNFVYLIMSMHLSAYISIQMYSFLTILAPPTIYLTNADILKSGLQPYLMPSTKYFVNDPPYIEFANTSYDCDSFLDCEEKFMKYDGVTAVTDSMFIALQADTAVNDEARTLRVPENLLTMFHEMLLRKGLHFVERFQEIMTRLRESGISDRLYDEGIGILTKSKSDSAAKNMMSHSYSCGTGCSITLAQSAGAFYLWMIGCGLSLCIFIVEVMLKRERKARNVVSLSP
ncbi:hypothetical protein ABMA27_004764 [Loxostege sticticalis]|uniref:Ionotropic receptor n=1 Tax=Loxostege sticticalis TaxID=481309 RepID=A0ABR3HKH9_LOXSC